MKDCPSFGHVPELEGCLTAYDFGEGHVAVNFSDGSHVYFDNAFFRIEGESGEYFVIYTEHCGTHTFHWFGWGHEYMNVTASKEWDEAKGPDPRGKEFWTKQYVPRAYNLESRKTDED